MPREIFQQETPNYYPKGRCVVAAIDCLAMAAAIERAVPVDVAAIVLALKMIGRAEPVIPLIQVCVCYCTVTLEPHGPIERSYHHTPLSSIVVPLIIVGA